MNHEIGKDEIFEIIKKYFEIFRAKIKTSQFIDDKVIGDIYWDNNDEQKFSWTISKIPINYGDTIKLIDYLINNNLFFGDKIGISRSSLIEQMGRMGWGSERTNQAIESLCEIHIEMGNGMENSDYFFVHF